MKNSKMAVRLLLVFGMLLLNQSAMASQKCVGELNIINNSNASFNVIDVHGNGVVINGDPTLKPNKKFTFNVGCKDAKGQVRYIDDTHHEVINLNYDYTQSGSVANVTGGKKYYQYTGLCTVNGNKIVITDKQ